MELYICKTKYLNINQFKIYILAQNAQINNYDIYRSMWKSK